MQDEVEQRVEVRWHRDRDPALPPESRVAGLGFTLNRWAGTPYRAGERLRGRGVDCVNFVDAVLCELKGVEAPPLPSLPGMHPHLRELERRHAHERLETHDRILPGDVLLVRGSGMGHVFIVGPLGNDLWHAVQGTGVCYTGMGAVMGTLHRAWRPKL